MSFRDQDASESSRNRHGSDSGSSPMTGHPCDLPIRIVVVESLPGSNSGVFRVISGRQCEQSPHGAGFICSARLPGQEIFLEMRSINRELHFEAASVVRESQTPDGRWRYDAVFVERTDRVDRYEFD